MFKVKFDESKNEIDYLKTELNHLNEMLNRQEVKFQQLIKLVFRHVYVSIYCRTHSKYLRRV
jgi:hypothetical protein